MGLIRKSMSISTGGVVNFRSKRDLQKAQLKADTKLTKEQAALAKSERAVFEAEHPVSGVDASKPWWQQSTVRAAAQARRAEPATGAESDTPAEGSLAAELERLADLHDRGVLTDAEFADAKQRALQNN